MATLDPMAEHLQVLIRAKYSVIAVQSKEERRIEGLIRAVADSLKDKATQLPFEVRYWSCTKGVTKIVDGVETEVEMVTEPDEVLVHIQNTVERAIYVLRDFHPYLRDHAEGVHKLRRRLRELVTYLKGRQPAEARTVILLSPVLEIPVELDGDIHVAEWPLPTKADLATVVGITIAGIKDPAIKAKAEKVPRERVINAAVGLTTVGTMMALARSLVDKGTLDPALIAQEKQNSIGDDGVLEWLEPLPDGLDGVGGLDVVKQFVLQRQGAFSTAARAYRLDPQKGLFLFGVPGAGKTHLARAIAGQYGFFALRLAVANLFTAELGGTEARWRMARRRMKALAPLVVLVDEIDKAAGGEGGERDGGTSGRFMGEFLTWLQETTDPECPVYKIATANNFETIVVNRPELVRKGRWDEVFFVDLPTFAEREAVAEIHVKKRYTETPQLNFAPINYKAVAAATPMFSPSEIEAVVAAAMFRGFDDGQRPTTTDDVVEVAKATMPLAKTAAGRIESLRKWAEGRAVRASRPEPTEMVGELASLSVV